MEATYVQNAESIDLKGLLEIVQGKNSPLISGKLLVMRPASSLTEVRLILFEQKSLNKSKIRNSFYSLSFVITGYLIRKYCQRTIEYVVKAKKGAKKANNEKPLYHYRFLYLDHF